MMLALLLPDPCDTACPPSFKEKARSTLSSSLAAIGPTDVDLRQALLDFIENFSDWHSATDGALIDISRKLVRAAHDESPLVVDSFAGGGAIPFEALRLGCETFASDLNPIACLILKTMLNDIPGNVHSLKVSLKRFGDTITGALRDDLSSLYPRDSDARPIAYLWARTVLCEAPNCGAEIPLTRSFWLSKKKDRRKALRMKGKSVIGKTPEFEIYTPRSEDDVREATVTRAKATCMACGTSLSPDRVRAQLRDQHGGADVIFDAKGRRVGGARLLAIAMLKNEQSGRFYRLPENRDYEPIFMAQNALRKKNSALLQSGLSEIPDEKLPPAGTLGFRVQPYGMSLWADIFSARQKLALMSLTGRIRNLTGQVSEEVGDLLALMVGRIADLGNAGTPWEPGAECPRHLFSAQKVPPMWDWAEAVLTSDASGSFANVLDRTVATLDTAFDFDYETGAVALADARDTKLPSESASLFFIDPPYYDAVPYADLSDFFFVWLKRTLPGNPLLRDPFSPDNPLTPKEQEAVQDDSKEVDGKPKNGPFFENAMKLAFNEGRRLLTENGIACIVFAHKTTKGWEALLSGMIQSRWVITGSWPIATEMGSRLRARESAALATSVHLVCRPRPPDAPIGDWDKVSRELPLRVHSWMERLSREGIRGADLVFACIGPAMELYSQYSKVLDSQDREVPLGGDPTAAEPYAQGYLAKVWEVVGRIALQKVLGKEGQEAGSLEEDARLTALFLWTLQSSMNGKTDAAAKEEDEEEDDSDEGDQDQPRRKGYTLVYDIVRRFAQPLGIRLENWEGRIIETKKGVVRLIPVTERESELFGEEGVPSGSETSRRKGVQTTLFQALDSDRDVRS